jgi:predicted nicotinamide N-methyase
MKSHHLLQNIQSTLPDAQITATPLPLCPVIKLYLINPHNIQRPFATDEIQAILANTPFWVFCWPGGQALAYYILQNKHYYKGKCILDFGSGSGVVAIAAAMAGAAKVIACDIDSNALDATRANAELNNVEIDTCVSLDEVNDTVDVIIAADVLYDPDNHRLLETLPYRAQYILIAVSRVNRIDSNSYQKVTEIKATLLPDLDAAEEFKSVSLYRTLANPAH